MTKAFDALTRARTVLILDQPFFGQLALKLKLQERSDIRTLATDGIHMYYNAKFVDTLTADEVKTGVAHEVFHCVWDHLGRCGDRSKKRFNYAADYVINLLLTDSGFRPIKGWLYDTKFIGMSTDHVYNLIDEPPPDDDDGTPGIFDDLMEADPEAREVLATDWRIATIQAAKAANAVDKLPGNMKRFIDRLTNPKVDWRAVLRRFVTETAKNDFCWTRPARKFIGQGICMPSLYSEAMGEIVVAIDTSGSIDGPTLTAFGSEIQAIVDNARPAKTVIYCDSAVNHVDVFDPGEPLHFDMHGGGGTDFRPPFEYVKEHGLHPVCFVYLTDMYGPFPDEQDYPILWCATTDIVGPHGETVKLEI
jgi:predicted metal-dependent peptidase